MRNVLNSLTLLAALALVTPALADSFKEGGLPYKDVAIKDIKSGKLLVEINGTERSYALATITDIDVGNALFSSAESAAKEPVKAVEFYRRAISALGNGGKKRVAEARALPLFDSQGRYGEAINAFLDVYQNDPTPGTWELCPKNLPDTGSAYLKDAASAINAKLGSGPLKTNADAQKNLRNLLLTIYVKQGDAARATETAKLLGVDVPAGLAMAVAETPTNPSAVRSTDPVVSSSSGSYVDVDVAIGAKNYDRAITLADALLPNAKEDIAIRLFKSKAQAYIGQGKPEAAAGAYLRISAHYPANIREGSEALLAAAEIQAKLAHLAAAEIDAKARTITDKADLKNYLSTPDVLTKLAHADEAHALVSQLKTNPKYKDTPAAVKAARITIDRPAAPTP